MTLPARSMVAATYVRDIESARAFWMCLTDADEILMTVPAAFIASQEGRGIAAFLSRQ